MKRRFTCIIPLLALSGCLAGGDLAATQPATAIDAQFAEPEYWLSQPATATAAGPDFDRLWDTAEDAARSLFYTPDRADRRGGVLTTEPTITSQCFEPWRGDCEDAYDTAESSLASIRRTIRFEFTKLEDGSIQVAPKVLVERFAQTENRISSVVLYRSVFKLIRPTDTALVPYGTRETDRGVYIPKRYWYAIGRDTALEQALADDIRRRMAS